MAVNFADPVHCVEFLVVMSSCLPKRDNLSLP